MPLTIGLDLDNTTCDFDGGFTRYLQTHDAFASKPFPLHHTYDLVASGWFSDLDEFLHYFHAAEKAGLYRELEVFPHAVETLHALQAQGNRIVAVTARSDVYARDTRDWLHAHRLELDDIIHTDAKEQVSVDVFLDDADYQLTKLVAHGKQVIAHTQPYNLDLEGFTRFDSWKQLPQLLQELVNGQAKAA